MCSKLSERNVPLFCVLLRSLSFPVSTTITLDVAGIGGCGAGTGGGADCFTCCYTQKILILFTFTVSTLLLVSVYHITYFIKFKNLIVCCNIHF